LASSVATTPVNLLYCFAGVLVGTLVGVLPGVGPPAALSLLLPVTFHVPPVSAVILLAGIMYGAMYGGSTTSILVNIPGEARLRCHLSRRLPDGQERKGRTGARDFCVRLIHRGNGQRCPAGPPRTHAGQIRPQVRSPEYFSLMVLGLSILVYLARGSIINALLIVCLGLLLGTVGLDPMSGSPRFIYKITTLMDGIGLVQVVIGLFGISEVLLNVETTFKQEIFETKIKGLLPNREDWKRSIGPSAEGRSSGSSWNRPRDECRHSHLLSLRP